MIWKENGIYMIDDEEDEVVVKGFVAVAAPEGPPNRKVKRGDPVVREETWTFPPVDQFQEEQVDDYGDPDLETGKSDMVSITKQEYDLFRWMKFYFVEAAQKQKGFDIQQHHAKRMGDCRYEIYRMLKNLKAHDDPEGDLKEPR